MPRRARYTTTAYFYHVMNRSSRRVPLFAGAKDYLALFRVLSEGLDMHPVEALAFCVMPNHWHLVLRVDRQPDLSEFMHWVTTTHARRWHMSRGTVGLGPVYKGRFLAMPIEAEADLVRVCRYVERNPVKAGLVRRAQDWRWSSLSERRRPRRRVPMVIMPFLNSPAWTDYVNTTQTMTELVAMERHETRAALTPAT